MDSTGPEEIGRARLGFRRAAALAAAFAVSRAVVAVDAPIRAGEPAPPAPPGLDTPALRVRFDPERGRLAEFFDEAAARDHADRGIDLDLWTATLEGGRIVSPGDADRFSWKRFEGSEPALELAWDGFGAAGLPGLRVAVRWKAGAAGSSVRSRIAFEGLGGRRLREVRFPRIAVARSEEETLAVPVWMGERTRRARELLGGGSSRLAWEYPGILSLQCLAFYREGGPGIQLAANDAAALRKVFSAFGVGRDGLAVEVVHIPPLAADGDGRYEPPYDAIVAAFSGDWFTAAESYRSWAREQAWARESRLRRGLVPEWLRETGLWVWNRGRSPGVLGPAARLQDAAGVPVSVLWHWWHGCAYDAGFPEYFPPREGAEAFRRALSDASARGLRAIVYMNQRLWGMATASWQAEGAARYAVKAPDGSVTPEVYNAFTRTPCASMCMGTEFWRSKYAGLAERAIRDLGADGIYMDQACSSLACYDPAHGHPLGGGAWWMDGFRLLEREIRARSAGRPAALAGEGCGEAWLPHLDAMLSLQVSRERYAAPGEWEPIPFFQAVYHDCALLFGSYSSLARPPYDELWPAEFAPERPLELLDRKFSRQFLLEQARAFAWGQQPAIANFLPEHLAERKEEVDYALRLARLRLRALSYLRDGLFLRPPAIDAPRARIPMSRLSIYAGQRDAVREFEAEVPLVLASAWRAPDGTVAVAIASISDVPLEVELSVGAPEHPIAPSGRIRRISEAGSSDAGAYAGSRAAWTAALGPRDACVYELLGDSE